MKRTHLWNARGVLAAASLSLLFVGCGSDDVATPTPMEEDPGQHACESFGDEGSRVSAADDSSDAPEMQPRETPYTIELVDGAAGYVTLRGELQALLFAGEQDVVTGLFHEDDLDTDLLGEGTPNAFCELDIPEHFDLELEEAGNYRLQLGPAAIGELWVVYIDAEGHAHEHQ